MRRPSPEARDNYRRPNRAIKRRELLLLAAAAATAQARVTVAAEAKVLRIGFIQTGARKESQTFLDAFRDALSVRGWDGGKLVVLGRWAEEHTERLSGIVKEVMDAGVAALVTAGTPATLAAARATATTPIVLVGVDDPVALGLVDSLARPGGNVTGLSLISSEIIMKRLQLLREVVPRLHRLAVIVRGDPGLEQKLQDIHSDANGMGIEVLALEAATGKALDLAFMRLRAEHCDAIYVASGPLGPAKRAQIIALAADSALPAIYSFRAFPADGGLMSFAADYADLFRRAAGFVDKILEGATPADLPIEPPRKFDLTINMKTAKALGLSFPPAILTGADEVIE